MRQFTMLIKLFYCSMVSIFWTYNACTGYSLRITDSNKL